MIAYDRPNAVARRLEIRPTHLKHLESLGDKLILAGPFLNDKDEGIGSIVVVEAETLDAAKMLVNRDPFVVDGLFDSITIKPWKLSINNTRRS